MRRIGGRRRMRWIRRMRGIEGMRKMRRMRRMRRMRWMSGDRGIRGRESEAQGKGEETRKGRREGGKRCPLTRRN